MKTREINKILKANPVMEGAGVYLKRAFGYHQLPAFDPFLMLDDFRNDSPSRYMKGFPWHPHRGIETITYILEGVVEHSDSMGNKGEITSGDVQWMTAGSGIVHQEMPRTTENGKLMGFQLWANLPAASKMMKPRYQDVKSADIPEVVLENGVKVKVIMGRLGNITGPVKDIVIDPEFLDIAIPSDTVYEHTTKPGHTVFAYVIGGVCSFGNDSAVENEHVVLFGDGDLVHIKAATTGVRLLLLSGKPIKEPVAWGGPIVMNTQKELERAFDEYENGTFLHAL